MLYKTKAENSATWPGYVLQVDLLMIKQDSIAYTYEISYVILEHSLL